MSVLSIVVPCYNEEKNISLILERFKAAIGLRQDIELILVDNGSTDDSAQVLARCLPEYSFARTIHVPVNKGYGHGILEGLRATTSPLIGWTHADLQTDPLDVLKALDIIEQSKNPECTYVKGNRRGRPFFDCLFSWGMGIFETAYLGIPLWEVNAQPNLFHRRFFETWRHPPADFSLDLYALYMARRQNLEIIRIDVHFPERLHGQSKWNTSWGAKLKFIRRTVDYSSTLKGSLADEFHSPSD